tara:strand:- start:12344 stop:12574 length:231 start_codon:yes stop_codon:yes gene_type:complete
MAFIGYQKKALTEDHKNLKNYFEMYEVDQLKNLILKVFKDHERLTKRGQKALEDLVNMLNTMEDLEYRPMKNRRNK